MDDQFTVRLQKDNIYEVVERATNEVVYSGTISEVNAWLDMYAKGFVL